MNEHLHFTDEEIVDYLDGSMEGQLRDSLEAVLATDETLKMRVEKMRVAIIAVKQLGLKEKIRAVAAEEKGKQTTETRRYGVTRKILRYSMVAAASVIVFIVLFKVFDKKPGNEDLYLQAYVDYQDNGVRGNENVSPIEDAYRQKKYFIVASLALNGKAVSQKDSFLTGVSYLKTKQTENAIKWLRPVSYGGPFQQDAEFYLALAYLKNGDTKTAASLMRSIHDNPAHVYKNQFSEELIEKVEKKEPRRY
jgi:hypothetical protein